LSKTVKARESALPRREALETRLTFPLAFKPLRKPLPLAENDLAEPLPLALESSWAILATTQNLVKLEDLEDRVRQNWRHLEELRHVMLDARGKRWEEKGGEVVLPRTSESEPSMRKKVTERTTALTSEKPFSLSSVWTSSERKRSCAVRRLRTCDSGYSGCGRGQD
jgi:hypothetical protein